MSPQSRQIYPDFMLFFLPASQGCWGPPVPEFSWGGVGANSFGRPEEKVRADCMTTPERAQPGRRAIRASKLGCVDEFDQAKACGEADDGSEVSFGLFAAE